MKNILFLMRYPLDEAYNLKQKFDGQMQSTAKLGYNVYHLAYDKKNIYLVNVNQNTKSIVRTKSFGSLKAYRSTFGFYDLFIALKTIIKDIHFDCIYMRSKIVNSTAINAFKNYKTQGGKLIVEIPSYGSDEQTLSFFRKIVQKILSVWCDKLPQYVDLYTIIGSNTLNEYKGRPALCISNGVCVENYPVHQHKFSGGLYILALASMRNWQGYDRLIAGLSAYSGEIPVYIEMVGNDGDGSLENWKNLSKELGVSHLVHFHGALYGDALNEMTNHCDIAAATLGMHRKSNGIASALKAREYTARGIPFIYSYNDTNLSGDEPFALKIIQDDSPVDIEKVVSWAMNLLENESVADDIRIFAQDNMSWESQLKKAFNFIWSDTIC